MVLLFGPILESSQNQTKYTVNQQINIIHPVQNTVRSYQAF